MIDWNLSLHTLEERLSSHVLQKCLSMEMQSRGWVQPKEESGRFVHILDQHMQISLGVEKKLLPTSVVNQFAKERAVEIEKQQGFEPGKKQLRDIKESVLVDLLPRAFTLRHKTSAWIDSVNGWFIIDTSSPVKADEFLEIFFKTVANLQLRPLKTKLSPTAAMTGWLAENEAPALFSIDRHCELRARDDEKSTVNYIRHNLDTEEIRRHVQTGKDATKLAMTWRDKISFVLHENLQLKRIVPLDILEETSETVDEKFDSDFIIMTGELKQLITDIIEELGGEEGDPSPH